MAGETDLFSNPGSTEDKKDDLFSGNQPPQEPQTEEEKYLEKLVGEGRKYSDTEALAKSRIHADNHISQLEKDNEELRQELQKRLGMEEFYEKLQEQSALAAPSNTPDEPYREERVSGQNEMSQDTIKALINDSLGEFVSAQNQEKNISAVKQELRNRLGDGFQEVMRERARQLGESTNDLMELAATKPQVFLELMAPSGSPRSQQPMSDPSMPRTQVNSSSSGDGGNVRNQTYYNKLKQTDPSRYHSKEVRVQMMNDALNLGEHFYT